MPPLSAGSRTSAPERLLSQLMTTKNAVFALMEMDLPRLMRRQAATLPAGTVMVSDLVSKLVPGEPLNLEQFAHELPHGVQFPAHLRRST